MTATLFKYANLNLSRLFLYLWVFSEGRNDPKIFTKDGSVHIRSGDNGNIVFEHPSPAGKVIVAGRELVKMLKKI